MRDVIVSIVFLIPLGMAVHGLIINRSLSEFNTPENVALMGQPWVDEVLKRQRGWYLKFGALTLLTLFLWGLVIYAVQ